MNTPKNIPADSKGTKFGEKPQIDKSVNDPDESRSNEVPLNKGSNVAGYTY